jgi:hypothetical protein
LLLLRVSRHIPQLYLHMVLPDLPAQHLNSVVRLHAIEQKVLSVDCRQNCFEFLLALPKLT